MKHRNPDLNWYLELSELKKVPPRCPYATAHKCNRYYSSIYLLGQLGITTKMTDEIVKELDEYWKDSGLIPLIEEHEPGVEHEDMKLHSVSNFCPEVSFQFLGLFAKYMCKYVDDIDRGYVQQQLISENDTNSYRWSWMSVQGLHYTECNDYSLLPYTPVPDANEEEIFEMKPGVFGFNINLRALYRRAKKHLTSKSR